MIITIKNSGSMNQRKFRFSHDYDLSITPILSSYFCQLALNFQDNLWTHKQQDKRNPQIFLLCPLLWWTACIKMKTIYNNLLEEIQWILSQSHFPHELTFDWKQYEAIKGFCIVFLKASVSILFHSHYYSLYLYQPDRILSALYGKGSI